MSILKNVGEIVLQLISAITVFKSSSENQPSVSSAAKEDDSYYIWKKGERIALSKYFDSHEFDCQCTYSDCIEQKISKTLITRLDKIRVEIAQPLIVTSGFRCTKHQQDLVKSGVNTVVAAKSTHELGDAADIVPADHKEVRTTFLDICAKYFEAIGLSDKFLHVDLRSGKKRRWEY